MAIDGSDIKGSNPGSQQAAQSKGVLIWMQPPESTL